MRGVVLVTISLFILSAINRVIAQEANKLILQAGIMSVDTMISKKGLPVKLRMDSLNILGSGGEMGSGYIVVRSRVTNVPLTEDVAVSRCVKYRDTLIVTTTLAGNAGVTTFLKLNVKDSIFSAALRVENQQEKVFQLGEYTGRQNALVMDDSCAYLAISKESGFTHNQFVSGLLTIESEYYEVKGNMMEHQLIQTETYFRCRYVDTDVIRKKQEDLDRLMKLNDATNGNMTIKP